MPAWQESDTTPADRKSPHGKTKLDLGAGGVEWRGPEWWMCDVQAAPDHPFMARYDFVDAGLGSFADDSAECVFMMHILEHIGGEAEAIEGRLRPTMLVLRDIRRVLQPGGIVRIGVPDLRAFAEAYVNRDEDFFHSYCDILNRGYDGYAAEFVKEMYQCGLGIAPDAHRWFYDEEMLRVVLERAGFTDIWRSVYQESAVEELRGPTFDNRPTMTLYMEARK